MIDYCKKNFHLWINKKEEEGFHRHSPFKLKQDFDWGIENLDFSDKNINIDGFSIVKLLWSKVI
jgi:hypothetical protein